MRVLASPTPVRLGPQRGRTVPRSRHVNAVARAVCVADKRVRCRVDKLIVAASTSNHDEKRSSTTRNRRSVLFGFSTAVASFGYAITSGARPATAVTPPPTPDANTSPYIKNLLARTEANKDFRKAELSNKNCLRQSAMGIGDCAGLPEDELVRAMAESKTKLTLKLARERQEMETLARQVEAYEARLSAEPSSEPVADAANAAEGISEDGE